MPGLSRTLESVTDAFYTLDREWRFTFVNRRPSGCSSASRAEMLGHSVWDVFPEAVGTIFDLEFRRAMETGEAAVFESYYPPLDLWVAVRAYPSDDGLAVYFLDIAEQSLIASEERYRSLFERAGDAVLIADDTGRYIDANPAACALLGVTRDVAIGRSLMDFVDPSDGLPDADTAWSMFLAAGEMRGHVRIRRPDDTIRDAEFLATANVTPGRHLSVLRDDTERLAAQTALVEAVAALTSSKAASGPPSTASRCPPSSSTPRAPAVRQSPHARPHRLDERGAHRQQCLQLAHSGRAAVRHERRLRRGNESTWRTESQATATS